MLLVHQNTGKENRYGKNFFAVLISTLGRFDPANKKKTVIYTLNDRDRLTKWGHQLVEQAINTSSDNLGDVITLIIHIVVIVEDQ